jgi:hypothetical protein
MVSARKLAANRQNAKKSTGPRTPRGKSQASRNAIRHGLKGAKFGDAGLGKKVERLAKAICKGNSDPFRFEQAIIIAESQVLLARVRAARSVAIQRLRSEAQPRLTWRGGPTAARSEMPQLEDSDEAQLVCRALPELMRLERYERRALSRRRKAIRRFDALGDE